LALRRKSDPVKMNLARRLRRETTLTPIMRWTTKDQLYHYDWRIGKKTEQGWMIVEMGRIKKKVVVAQGELLSHDD
jgi:hypothetical protein